jgi:hypothetical protein
MPSLTNIESNGALDLIENRFHWVERAPQFAETRRELVLA